MSSSCAGAPRTAHGPRALVGTSTGTSGALVLRRGVPFLLALINAVLLPALTRLLVRRWLGRQRSMIADVGGAVAARLLLMARLITTVAIPVGAVLVLGEGCGEGWKSLWSACLSNTTVSYSAKTGCHTQGKPACDNYIPSLSGLTNA